MFINLECLIYFNYYSRNLKMFYRLSCLLKLQKKIKYQSATSEKLHFQYSRIFEIKTSNYLEPQNTFGIKQMFTFKEV